MPPLRAVDLWDVLPEDFRRGLALDEWVYPCSTRLAMGASHAVHIIMNINLTAVGRTLWSGARLGSVDAELQALENSGREVLKRKSDLNGGIVSDRIWDERTSGRETGLFKNRGISLNEWVDLCHAARRGLKRVFIFVHICSGPERSGDVSSFISKLGAAAGLSVLAASMTH